METATDSSKQAPPYFAYKTFLNQADLMKEKGIPKRIDRSFLLGMSGAAQTQYIAGMRSLGFIDADGAALPILHEFVNGSKSERQTVLARVLREPTPKPSSLARRTRPRDSCWRCSPNTGCGATQRGRRSPSTSMPPATQAMFR